MDVSSELIHSLLPVFMVTTLGASMVTVGLIEGVAEATAAITKVFSGALSDYLGKRKFLMVLGYALAAFTKPVFPLATSVGWVFGGAFRGPRRQGHPRRAARRAGGRPHAAAAAGRCLRPSPGAGFGGRPARPAARGAVDGLARRRHQGGHVDRRRAGIHGGGAARLLRPRAGAQCRGRRRPEATHARRRQAPAVALLARRAAGRRLHAGALQRGLSGAARPGRRRLR